MERMVEVSLVLSARAAHELDEATAGGASASDFIAAVVEEAVDRGERGEPPPSLCSRRGLLALGVAVNVLVAGAAAALVICDINETRRDRALAESTSAALVQRIADLQAQVGLQRTVIEQQHALTGVEVDRRETAAAAKGARSRCN